MSDKVIITCAVTCSIHTLTDESTFPNEAREMLSLKGANKVNS